MSAYNYFFKEEREKILRVILPEDPSKVVNEPGTEDYLDEETIASLKKDGNKVSFEQIGKIIGSRWKSVDPDRLARFTELAASDTERYKKEMQSYNTRQEAKMRNEAVKPPAVYPGAPKGPPPGGDPRAMYPPEMNPYMGGYYGMDYGYGGGMAMYPPPYGYPPQMGGSPPQEMRGENPYAMYGQPPMGMPAYGYPEQGYPPMDPYAQGYPQGAWGGQ